MKQIENILLLYTKYPIPGRVKTRLIPYVTSQKAAEIHHALVLKTIETLRKLKVLIKIKILVFYEGGSEEQVKSWIGEGFDFKKQISGSLGEKLNFGFKNAFLKKYKSCITIGSDCYDLDTKQILDAIEKLKHDDLVLGPAEDGGYYLIGLSKYEPSLFQNID